MRKRSVVTVPTILAAALALLCCAAPAFAATAGNGYYQVNVSEDPNGTFGLGMYQAMTGEQHPIWLPYGEQRVLFGGFDKPSTWNVIHSYTSGTTYTQNLLQVAPLPPDGPVRLLQDFAVEGEWAVPIGTTGIRTHYRITNGGYGEPKDDLDILQTINVVGTTFNDSAVEISMEVSNISDHEIDIGIRYLLDFQVGLDGDDGPTFQLKGPDGPVEVVEQNLPSPTATSYEIIDNNDPAVCFGLPPNPFPLYAVSGTVMGPAALNPTPPTLLQYVLWGRIAGFDWKYCHFVYQDAFFYTIAPEDAATCDISCDDSAVAYFWGDNEVNAIHLAPGQGTKVSAFLFAYLPGQPPTFPVVPENQPPDCSAASPSKDLLWPPNHKFKAVTVEGVTDPDGDPVSITIQGITQDEPVRAPGSGNTCPDAEGAGSDTAKVRVERSGRGDGRIYHIDFEAADGKGGTCVGSVALCVPHDMSKSKVQCVDQGPLFDSTAGCTKPGKNNGGGKNK